jgi:hypothetical protein
MYQMEKEIMSSGLDVTALRAPILVDEPVNGKYRVIENEDYLERLQISRTDLAKFLIGELENRRWNNRVIAIADDV